MVSNSDWEELWDDNEQRSFVGKIVSIEKTISSQWIGNRSSRRFVELAWFELLSSTGFCDQNHSFERMFHWMMCWSGSCWTSRQSPVRIWRKPGFDLLIGRIFGDDSCLRVQHRMYPLGWLLLDDTLDPRRLSLTELEVQVRTILPPVSSTSIVASDRSFSLFLQGSDIGWVQRSLSNLTFDPNTEWWRFRTGRCSHRRNFSGYGFCRLRLNCRLCILTVRICRVPVPIWTRVLSSPINS